jgi:hypothetical protein
LSALELILQTYLNKFSNTTKLINDTINNDCKQIIIIPSYCEPDLEKTLNSLVECDPTKCTTQVFVVLNSAQEDVEAKLFHQKQKTQLEQQFLKHTKLVFNFILVDDLPAKHAGVGLARKIGMDEAIRQFKEIDFDGLLICLDGDCVVNKNYLVELENYSRKPETYNTICLHFEHELESEKDESLKQGIIFYELFLRYYKECLMYCNFPYAYHTIGSSMAVKASIYCKAGGMNKRKAGEDFYFLTKVFPYGKVIELNSAIVYPSARVSTRVPFGTGRAQQNYLENQNEQFKTYAHRSFEDLKQFFLNDFYEGKSNFNSFPETLKHFINETDLKNKLSEIKNNTTSKQQFTKRFFDWFDGFMVLKFVHFVRDTYYPNMPILQEVSRLFKDEEVISTATSEQDQLLLLRKIQVKNK